MNIIEAIKSGKPFRRKSWTHADYFVVDEDNFRYLISGDRTVIGNVNAILTDDWEIQEKTITISEKQFDEAFMKASDSIVRGCKGLISDLIKMELGF